MERLVQMINMTRAIGTRLLDALVPQKSASAGCSPDCWCVSDVEGGQGVPCAIQCCYTPNCNVTCNK
jgi:hypothetical protein